MGCLVSCQGQGPTLRSSRLSTLLHSVMRTAQLPLLANTSRQGTYVLNAQEAAAHRPRQVASLAGRSGFGQRARVHGFGGSNTETATPTRTAAPTQTQTMTTAPTRTALETKTAPLSQRGPGTAVAAGAPTPPADPGGSKTATEQIPEMPPKKDKKNDSKGNWFLIRWLNGLKRRETVRTEGKELTKPEKGDGRKQREAKEKSRETRAKPNKGVETGKSRGRGKVSLMIRKLVAKLRKS